MSEWGNFTPGPWEVYANGARVRLGPSQDEPLDAPFVVLYGGYTEHVPPRTQADARLISKAYLIPRLEAALDNAIDCVQALANNQPALQPEADAYRALLAELRQP